jgi:hypothetical protein
MAKNSEASMVKSYRVLRDGMKVGNSVRNTGDLIPEAANFENLAVYLRNNFVEKVYVSHEEIAEHEAKVAKELAKVEKKTKKTVKKPTAKKRVVKIAKKGVNSHGELAEQSV